MNSHIMVDIDIYHKETLRQIKFWKSPLGDWRPGLAFEAWEALNLNLRAPHPLAHFAKGWETTNLMRASGRTAGACRLFPHFVAQ